MTNEHWQIIALELQTCFMFHQHSADTKLCCCGLNRHPIAIAVPLSLPQKEFLLLAHGQTGIHCKGLFLYMLPTVHGKHLSQCSFCESTSSAPARTLVCAATRGGGKSRGNKRNASHSQAPGAEAHGTLRGPGGLIRSAVGAGTSHSSRRAQAALAPESQAPG
jgi:hypothetical protein